MLLAPLATSVMVPVNFKVDFPVFLRVILYTSQETFLFASTQLDTPPFPFKAFFNAASSKGTNLEVPLLSVGVTLFIIKLTSDVDKFPAIVFAFFPLYIDMRKYH